jgi:cytochrome c-type biogenesis protein CcmE
MMVKFVVILMIVGIALRIKTSKDTQAPWNILIIVIRGTIQAVLMVVLMVVERTLFVLKQRPVVVQLKIRMNVGGLVADGTLEKVATAVSF